MADTNPGDGNAETLRRYWTVGAGGIKIAWGTPGDWTRCVRYVSDYMSKDEAEGYCARLHRRTTGMWPGDKNNR